MRPSTVALGIFFIAVLAAPRGVAEEPKKDEASDKGKESEDSEFSVEVLVLHATNSDKGIDPRIGKMPELEKPPFSSYKSYELLQRVRHPLKKGEPKTFRLPNGRALQTKLIEKTAKDTVRFSASIDKPGGKKFIPKLEVKAKLGQSFIVAGQSYKDGILVLVIKVVR